MLEMQCLAQFLSSVPEPRFETRPLVLERCLPLVKGCKHPDFAVNSIEYFSIG